jgi:hypothetical protein
MIIGETTQVSFKLDIIGSTEFPKVKVALECSPELVYYAHKTGDRWTVDINVPIIVQPGTYKLRIDVILANRLFTPISKMVEVTTPEVEVAQSVEVKSEPELTPAQPPVVDNSPADTPPSVERKSIGLIRQFASEEIGQVEREPKAEVAAGVKAPEKKTIQLPPDLFASLLVDATPKQKMTLPVKPTIQKEQAPVVENKKPREINKKKAPVIVEIKQETPVVLLKGDIVFE